jgi:hypothetical protein
MKKINLCMIIAITATVLVYGCGSDGVVAYLEEDGTTGKTAPEDLPEEQWPLEGGHGLEIYLDINEINAGKNAATFAVHVTDTIAMGWGIETLRFANDGDTLHVNHIVTVPEYDGAFDVGVLPDYYAYEWIETEKIGNDKLQVKLHENNSGIKREAWIGLGGPMLIPIELHVTQDTE